MARGVNKVILVGNMGNDPEMKYMPSGGAVTNISIATSESWKDKTTGQPQERTEWHRVVFFNKLAEIAGQYLKKGSKVYVEGALRTRKWQGQDGQDRYTTEIVASEMQMLDSRGEGGMGGGNFAPQAPAANMPNQAMGGQAMGGVAPPAAPQQAQYAPQAMQQAPQQQQRAPQPVAPQGQPQPMAPQGQPQPPQGQPQRQAAPQPMAPQQAQQQQGQQQAPQPMAPQGQPQQGQPQPAQSFDNFDDDIPF